MPAWLALHLRSCPSERDIRGPNGLACHNCGNCPFDAFFRSRTRVLCQRRMLSPQVQAVGLPGPRNQKKKMVWPSASRRSVRQRSEQNMRRKRPANARRSRIRSSVPPPQRLRTSAKRKSGVIGRNVNARSVLAARRSAKTKELRRKLGMSFDVLHDQYTFDLFFYSRADFMHLGVKDSTTGRTGHLQGLAGIGRD
ncbi:hypothetical protein BC826DRAFT_480653 [Russula brevipes]|nr:hypothetical protein BC826DRAFT_480653 [Russula brevipes]